MVFRYTEHNSVLHSGEAIVTTAVGQQVYTYGTHSWTCPANVYEVSVVCVGSGAGGNSYGGGGGGLGWKNNIPVVHTWGSCNNFTDGLLNVGIIGVSGQMAANIAIRASDKPIFLSLSVFIIDAHPAIASVVINPEYFLLSG